MPDPAGTSDISDTSDKAPAASSPAAAPGSSGPGEQGYGGAATVGDEGAAAGPEAYADPFGRPEDDENLEGPAG